MHIYVYICIYVHIYTYIYICIHIYIHITHTITHTHTHTHTTCIEITRRKLEYLKDMKARERAKKAKMSSAVPLATAPPPCVSVQDSKIPASRYLVALLLHFKTT